MKSLRIAAVISCLIWPTAVAFARNDSEFIRYFRSIRVEAGQTTSDAMCVVCPIYVHGKVDGDALTLGGDIVVQGEITGDAITLGGDVLLSKGSRIAGDATAVGGEVHREDGAIVVGESDSLPYFYVPGQRSLQIYGLLTLTAVNMAFAVLLGYLVPRRRSGNLADAIGSHPAATITAGVLFVTIFVALIWLAGTLPRVGVPFTVLLTLITVFAFCSGYAGLATFAGRISTGGKSRFLTLAAGAGLLTILLLVPIAGLAAMLVFVVLALGSVVVSGLGGNPDWLPRKLRRVSSAD